MGYLLFYLLFEIAVNQKDQEKGTILVNKTISGSNRLDKSYLLKYRFDNGGENGLNETFIL